MGATITRREFLKQSLSGTGLILAVSINPFAIRSTSAEVMKKEPSNAFMPSAWLQITPDNMVTVMVNRSEMGQGIYTSFPMIVAEELEADWEQVRFESAPARDEYKDPVWFEQVTAGSTSIRHMFEPLRKAGAAAREMLATAAAETWKVPVNECEASQGKIRHIKSNRSLTYGELCLKAASVSVPENPSLKKESQFRIIG
ncbi:MAG: xanthine dehydrogenase family protein molybdopterin-binding subunit, partial [Deltaproteobacteria bacterium]